MTRVLLTGANGFVGRQVLRSLYRQGAEVVAVLREGAPAPDGPADILRTKDLFAESVAFWERSCRDIDAIAHVAWYAEPGKYLHSRLNFDCLEGTLRLAKAAVNAGVSRFVGVGTCVEYDLGTPAVARREPLSVQAPLRPTTPYGAAKAAAWLALSQALPGNGVAFAWCRLFYLFGEGEDPRRLVPYLHDRLSRGETAELSSGNQIRDFMDVRDAGHQIAQTVLGTAEGALNICSGIPTTVMELATRIASEYRRPDLIRPGARPDNPDDPPFVLGVPSLPRVEALRDELA